jgi:hypothetical protein
MYVTSVSRGSLYEKFGNKCVKILKFWRTELSYAQNKNRGKQVRLLGMDRKVPKIYYLNVKVNNSTNIKKQINNLISRQIIEHKKTETYDDGGSSS